MVPVPLRAERACLAASGAGAARFCEELPPEGLWLRPPGCHGTWEKFTPSWAQHCLRAAGLGPLGGVAAPMTP